MMHHLTTLADKIETRKKVRSVIENQMMPYFDTFTYDLFSCIEFSLNKYEVADLLIKIIK